MAPTDIIDSQPYLTAAMLQAFLYALYLVSLVHALRWLLYEEEGWTLKSRDQVNWLLLTITLSVFMFSTVDVVLEVLLQLIAGSTSDTSLIVYQLGIASLVMENTTFLITDAVLIIRCWLVYQRSWRVVCFPLMLWLGNVALFVLWLTFYVISAMEGFTVQLHDLLSLFSLRSFYCCTFTMNLYATVAIVYRLRRVARENSNRSSILYHICRTVAATGILYTFTSLPLVVTTFFFPEKMAPYLICDAVNFSMAGITFNLLLVRVGQLRAEVEMDADGNSRGMSTSILFSTQLGVPKLATTDFSVDSASVHQRSQTDAKPVGSRSANK
ncbi:hypothetical protein M378DRAFT_1067629 [Amanita muscaria Koide BX008]|uniref:Uncharacterized protein n=1 Tax=Amanita muscaria (strain Koide BX008) TaxID=946122 RepID=A0A0C2SA32_AMAMK|nr:hypothetical protein M378DRAFT_1067629 [Amanita muscaria Koide BX008]